MLNSLIINIALYALYPLILLTVAVGFVLPRKERVQFGLLVVGAGVVALVMAKIGSHLFYDPRPFTHPGITALIPHARDNGFPSDHTLLATTLAASVMVFRRRIGLLLLMLAAMIGGARVLAHVHSPIDIIGAMIISGIAVATMYAVLRKGRTYYELVQTVVASR